MNFFKTNAHWLVLSGAAAASIGTTVWLLSDIEALQGRLEQLRPKPASTKKFVPLDLSAQKTVQEILENPGQWSTAYQTFLFVSQKYVRGTDGKPKKPEQGADYVHSVYKKEIPNQWFIEHDLPVLDPNVGSDDADGDGFSNEDEWWWGTDPKSPESHPPYATRLTFIPQDKVFNSIKFLSYSSKIPPLRVNVIWENAPNYVVSCSEVVLNTPNKPTAQDSYSFVLCREDDPKKPTASVKVSEYIMGSALKLDGWKPGPDGKPKYLRIRNAGDGGVKGAEREAEVGGAPADIPRVLPQKKWEIKKDELIPGTRIRFTDFQERPPAGGELDKSVLILTDEQTSTRKEVLYREQAPDAAHFIVDPSIKLKPGIGKETGELTLKLKEKFKIDPSEEYSVIEAENQEYVIAETVSGANQGKKWKITKDGGKLLQEENGKLEELKDQPKAPHWNLTPPPAAN